jgi:CRISPR-associated protein Csm3
MQLKNITTIKATLELVTGLRIGAGDSEMHIGGVDNTVIKHPLTQSPYIPGSSIKGKIRSLLEWRSGAVQAAPLGIKEINKPNVKAILQLFGVGGGDNLSNEDAVLIGPTRLSFWDCALNAEWEKEIRDDNLPLTEVKSENSINRISGTALNPRQTERVPASAQFDFTLSLKRLEGDGDELLETVLAGLKLLELDSLGGSGSRGYGKVRFNSLTIDGIDESARFSQVQPFAAI